MHVEQPQNNLQVGEGGGQPLLCTWNSPRNLQTGGRRAFPFSDKTRLSIDMSQRIRCVRKSVSLLFSPCFAVALPSLPPSPQAPTCTNQNMISSSLRGRLSAARFCTTSLRSPQLACSITMLRHPS